MEETKIAEALRPLLVLIRFSGFNINEHQPRKTFERVRSSICFVVITVGVFYNVSIEWKTYLTLEWNMDKIDYLNYSFHFFLTHSFVVTTSLYVLSYNGISDLWKALRSFEGYHCFNASFYRIIRIKTWMAVFYTIIYVSVIQTIPLHFITSILCSPASLLFVGMHHIFFHKSVRYELFWSSSLCIVRNKEFSSHFHKWCLFCFRHHRGSHGNYSQPHQIRLRIHNRAKCVRFPFDSDEKYDRSPALLSKGLSGGETAPPLF